MNHFVLIHGGGFGAWCWYKTIALLEEVGYRVTVVDLTGSGIHSFDTNNIASLSQYIQPSLIFFKSLLMERSGDGDWPRPDKSSKSTAKKKSRTPVDSNEKTLGLFKCFGSCWIN